MNNDRWIGLGFLILCALMWFVIIPGQTEGADEAFVPRLTVIGLAVPSLIMLVRRPRSVTPLNFDPGAFVRSTLPVLGLFIAYIVGAACRSARLRSIHEPYATSIRQHLRGRRSRACLINLWKP